MTDKNKDALEALERLVEKIPFDIDCEKVPRAVGFEAAFKDFMTVKAALTAQEVVTVEEIAALIKSEAHIAYPWTTIMAHYPNGIKIVKD